jgi:hypothetical protein
MSYKGQLIATAFAGYDTPLKRILIRRDSAVSPDGVVSAKKGTFLIMDYVGNAVNKDVYINTDGSSAWTLIHNETA